MRHAHEWILDPSPSGLASLRQALALPQAVGLEPLGPDVLLRVSPAAAGLLRVDGRPLRADLRVLLGGETVRCGRRRVRVRRPRTGGAVPAGGTRTRARAALAGTDGPVEGPALVVLEGPAAGRRWPLRPGTQRIGRGLDADVVLLDDTVSRRHARLELDGRGCLIVDDGSRHGLEVDGRRVRRARALRGSAYLRLGGTDLRYLPAPRPRPRRPAPRGRGLALAAGLLALGGALTAGTLLPW